MESLGAGFQWLPPASGSVLDMVTPATYRDAAALAVIAAASAAYGLRKYTWDKPDSHDYIFFERPQANDAKGGAARTTRNIAERLEELNRQVVIFWGSQSGTSEGIANRLARELHQHFRLEALAADLSDFDPDTIAQIPKTKLALFVLSTYGEGDPSDNTATFWDWANKVSESSLPSLQYAVFGLGNSDYKYYNRVAEVIDAALKKAGAEQLLPLGRADDAHGTTEEDFLAWRDDLLEFLGKHLGLESQDLKYEPVYNVVEDESLEPQDLHIGEPVESRDNNGKAAAANSPIRPMKIKAARELFSNSKRNCLHLDLDITEHPQISYKTGDHLAVWPMNPEEEVERLIRVLGLSARRNIPISITSLDAGSKVRVPTPTTVEALLRNYLEICAPVSRNTTRSLAEFVPEGAAKSFLLEVSKDRETFAKFIAMTHVNFGRLLEVALATADGASPSIPVSFLLEVLPRMQPRFYSVSSSSIVSPRAPSVTVLVSNSDVPEDPSAGPIPGLASNYLLALTNSTTSTAHPAGLAYQLEGPGGALEGASLFAHIVRSKFKLPMQASCPVVMVAAGTGLAPFRGFLVERARLRAMGKPVGAMMLFYGCRSAGEDNIYEDELGELGRALGDKLEVVRAFSRPASEGEGKRAYVQDKVRERGAEVRALLAADASVYVCGRVSMAREVEKTVAGLWCADKGMDEAATKDWSNRMKRTRKWQEDVWG